MTPAELLALLEAVREACAKAIEYRGQCAVTMINADERIEEKKGNYILNYLKEKP